MKNIIGFPCGCSIDIENTKEMDGTPFVFKENDNVICRCEICRCEKRNLYKITAEDIDNISKSIKIDIILEFKKFCNNIIANDKTPEYSYRKRDVSNRNRDGKLADVGQRWLTPRELARETLRWIDRHKSEFTISNDKESF